MSIKNIKDPHAALELAKWMKKNASFRGTDGALGDTGATGISGSPGISGRDGLPGRDGIKGDRGSDGKSPMHKGLYNKDTVYEAGDLVMLHDSTWFKTDSKSQELPGEGWKLAAKQGKTGRKGDRGATGDFAEMDYKTIQDLHDEILLLKDEVKRLKDARNNK